MVKIMTDEKLLQSEIAELLLFQKLAVLATQSSEGWSQADWKELSVEAVITATSAEPPPSLEVGLATPLMAPSCPPHG